jgi:AcrR family transcriptional regulator
MDGAKPSATKARILAAALELFNAEGAGALSAVDIAAALGISPGHLYYHFHGKGEILAALADAHHDEVALIIEAARDACHGDGATLEALWVHVHVLAEEAWDARFLYREAGALALRYPDLAARIRRLTTAQRLCLADMLTSLANAGVLLAPPEVIDGLARVMATAIAFHAIQLELDGDAGPPRERIARAAAQIMLLPAGFVRRPGDGQAP